MTKYKNISIRDYTYDLPQNRIADYPLEKRDASSLLVYKDGQTTKDVFTSVPAYLPKDALIVFNNTRVVQARLLFRKPTGALIEVFCLEPAGEVRDIQIAFQQKKQSSWFCLVGNAKKWKQGTLEMNAGTAGVLRARKGDQLKDGYVVHFDWDAEELSFAEILEQAGKTPLPPYIDRDAHEDDKHRYQTIFAQHAGSVAAPTAGLHFSDDVMQELEKNRIKATYVTLHVGAGTFKPVSSETMGAHQMHNEQIVVSRKTISQLQEHCRGTIVSVGTTSLRTLESLYWLGVKLSHGYVLDENGFSIHQWEPYEHTLTKLPAAEDALEHILQYMTKHKLENIFGETSLIILPGYDIKLANILITNFHQPGSTLLLLVAAFIGDDWKKVYNFALENNYRFLSYGDSCLLFRNKA